MLNYGTPMQKCVKLSMSGNNIIRVKQFSCNDDKKKTKKNPIIFPTMLPTRIFRIK